MNSKYLSLLLRHKPEKENLIIDEYGYTDVAFLLTKLNITKEELNNIVENNNKKRFEYNEDGTKIRATQGHSIKVKLDLNPILPPPKLFHGTTIDNLKSIKKFGLKSMNRNYVHLTWDYMTAFDVGLRYAKYKNKVIIFSIDAEKMNNDGFIFYKTSNNVYLTEIVPFKYMKIEND